MTVKRKAVYICCFVTVICLTLMYVLMKFILINNLVAFEKREVEAEISRAVNAIAYDLSSLENTALDWSVWDDTYEFIKDKNDQYIEANLQESSFNAIKANVIMYLDENNQLFYAKWGSDENGQTFSVSPESEATLYRSAVLMNTNNQHSFKGMLQLPEGPMLVVSQPIVDSKRQYPARGTFVIGRFLAERDLTKLANIIQLPIGLFPLQSETLSPGINIATVSKDNIKPVIKTGEETISGTVTLKDIFGENKFLLQTERERHIYKKGLNFIYTYSVLLTIISIALAISIYWLLERYVFRRLIHLTEIIDKIKDFEHVPESIDVKGNDEVTLLASKLQQLFIELNKHHKELRYLSTYDALTGAFNRSFYEDTLKYIDKYPNAKVGFIICDVDGLKLANDLHGHEYGDKLLIDLVQILKNSVPDDASIIRSGGDEFIIYLQENSEEVLSAICHEIRLCVDASTVNTGNRMSPLSISLGYASNEDENMNPQDIFNKADQSMYREKLLKTQSTRSGIVNMLRSALEARDFITEGHAHRLGEMAVHLAKSIQLPQSQVPDLLLLAEFHDVGKIGVPDRILFKQGTLTDDEWVEMKKHCETGFRIAKSTSNLAPIADLILKHHERWDGKGYPIGLAGEDVPVQCRILAIIDAYDAMTNDRPYRKGISKQEALAEINRCSGAQFDPTLVQEFMVFIKESESE